MYIFGWKYTQTSKTGERYGTMIALRDMVKLGGTDVSRHTFGAPIHVGFNSLGDAKAARELIEVHFDTFIHEDSASWEEVAA